nr:peptide-N(4)-(N-acetyl-beta-glucosaminyl)asparagine amidase [Misgurnus anguillicaudatus]
MKIKSASVRAFSQTFHSGNVRWSLRSAQTTTEFPGDGEMHSVASLSGGTELLVEAELTGGEGNESWQHAQLFRQSLKETENVLFELLVEIEES